MRNPVILSLIWAVASMTTILKAQSNIDLTNSVIPGELSHAVLAEQLDTSNQFRQTVNITYLQSEFPTVSEVFLETYYQKSGDHLLLEMSKGSIPLERTYLVSEGLGNTYWKISDGICWLLLAHTASLAGENVLEIKDKSCAE